jgi:hypothetical protein
MGITFMKKSGRYNFKYFSTLFSSEIAILSYTSQKAKYQAVATKILLAALGE